MVLWAKKLAHKIFLAHAQTVAAQGFQGFLGQKSIFQFNLSQKLNINNKKLTNIFGLLAQSVFLRDFWVVFEMIVSEGNLGDFWAVFEVNLMDF